eukprot:g4043.t1
MSKSLMPQNFPMETIRPHTDGMKKRKGTPSMLKREVDADSCDGLITRVATDNFYTSQTTETRVARSLDENSSYLTGYGVVGEYGESTDLSDTMLPSLVQIQKSSENLRKAVTRTPGDSRAEQVLRLRSSYNKSRENIYSRQNGLDYQPLNSSCYEKEFDDPKVVEKRATLRRSRSFRDSVQKRKKKKKNQNSGENLKTVLRRAPRTKEERLANFQHHNVSGEGTSVARPFRKGFHKDRVWPAGYNLDRTLQQIEDTKVMEKSPTLKRQVKEENRSTSDLSHSFPSKDRGEYPSPSAQSKIAKLLEELAADGFVYSDHIGHDGQDMEGMMRATLAERRLSKGKQRINIHTPSVERVYSSKKTTPKKKTKGDSDDLERFSRSKSTGDLMKKPIIIPTPDMIPASPTSIKIFDQMSLFSPMSSASSEQQRNRRHSQSPPTSMHAVQDPVRFRGTAIMGKELYLGYGHNTVTKSVEGNQGNTSGTSNILQNETPISEVKSSLSKAPHRLTNPETLSPGLSSHSRSIPKRKRPIPTRKHPDKNDSMNATIQNRTMRNTRTKNSSDESKVKISTNEQKRKQIATENDENPPDIVVDETRNKSIIASIAPNGKPPPIALSEVDLAKRRQLQFYQLRDSLKSPGWGRWEDDNPVSPLILAEDVSMLRQLSQPGWKQTSNESLHLSSRVNRNEGQKRLNIRSRRTQRSAANRYQARHQQPIRRSSVKDDFDKWFLKGVFSSNTRNSQSRILQVLRPVENGLIRGKIHELDAHFVKQSGRSIANHHRQHEQRKGRKEVLHPSNSKWSKQKASKKYSSKQKEGTVKFYKAGTPDHSSGVVIYHNPLK